jgi:formylglycine-generating enzyme required for sulfatase activity/tRNA A-37 threonylcarbamoyl transferase component Bud32
MFESPSSDIERNDPVDAACDRFESELRDGGAPRIEAYLAAADEVRRTELFGELLALEIDWRRYVGADPQGAEYEERFPDRVATVRQAFARMQHLPVVTPPEETDLDDEDAPSGGPTRTRGRFRIVRYLDSGGTGDVFVAIDEQLGREVALKQLQAPFADDPNHRQRLEFEARITGMLEHPGIVPVYAASRRKSGVPYYVSKLIRGQTLAQAIRRFHEEHHPWDRPDPNAQIALLRLLTRFLAVCDTITYAHERGVVHRDLKPQNILLGDHGETLVVDWGLARLGGRGAPDTIETPLFVAGARSELPPTIAAMGTPGYVSPEQLEGDTTAVGPASDVFALGATLYHVLTNRPPFLGAETTRSLSKQARAGDFPSPRALHRRIPRPLEAIVLKALAGQQRDRYSSPRELAIDLERWMADEPVSACDEPVSMRVRRFVKRRPMRATVVAAVFLGGIGLGLFAYQSSERERVRIETLLSSLRTASLEEVPELARRLATDSRRVRPRLLALRDEKEPGSVRFLHATLALLPIDPQAASDFERRLRNDPALAGALVAKLLLIGRSDARRSDELKDLLRPVRRALFMALTAEVRRTPQPDDPARSDRAARVLLDYAADAPEVLADVIPDVGLKLFPDYLKRLMQSPQAAVVRLEQVLEEPLVHRPRLLRDASWTEPEPMLVQRIEAAAGLVDPRFALCQTLPLAEFATLAEQLRPCGYRPIRVRPYRDGPLVRVAAVWNRDSLGWSLALGLKANQAREEDRRQKHLGRQPVDAAAYSSAAGETALRLDYAVLWSELTSAREQARRLVNGEYQSVPECHWSGTNFQLALGRDDPAAAAELARSLNAGERPLTCQRLRLADGSDWLTRIWVGAPHDHLEWPLTLTGDTRALQTQVAQQACFWDLALTLDDHAPGGVVYDATFKDLDDRACIAPHGLSPEEHRAQCVDLAQRGDCWPAAIAAAGRAEPGHVIVGSVWHRAQASKVYLARNAPEFRRARTIATLARLGRLEPLWKALRHQPDPTVRSLLLRDAVALGIEADLLIARVDTEADPSARRALLLALGSYPDSAIPFPARRALGERLMDQFTSDPDPGIHSAIGWLLRRWGAGDGVRRREWALATSNPPPDRGWFVNPQGQTFSVVRGPVTFGMGQPVRTAENEERAPWHEVTIERSFAVMTTEVTVAQFQPFLKTLELPPDHRLNVQDRYVWDVNCPMGNLDWYDAARYCNWLSRSEGIPEGQWCYRDGRGGTLELPENYLSRAGYRLPTEAEWEFACRAGALTDWPYGRDLITSPIFLDGYAWSILWGWNRTEPVGGKMPNDLGLFDMLGNTHEWCQDPYDVATYHRLDPGGGPRLDREFPAGPVPEKKNRVLRGGWFHYPSDGLRANTRSWSWASYPSREHGFRVARTIH